jgi:hypothetical protein
MRSLRRYEPFLISHRHTKTLTKLLAARPRPPRLRGSRWRAGNGRPKDVNQAGRVKKKVRSLDLTILEGGGRAAVSS